MLWHLNHIELDRLERLKTIFLTKRLIDKIIKSSFTLLSLIQFIMCAVQSGDWDIPKSSAPANDVFGS